MGWENRQTDGATSHARLDLLDRRPSRLRDSQELLEWVFVFSPSLYPDE
ncbi:MAG: hypothetical protein RL042_453 [Nitrospirota bacterium]